MLDYASIPESERIIVALDCDERRARELAEQLVGRATLNTNLLIPLARFSLNKPIFLNTNPRIITRKIGIVAFKL